MKSYLGLSLILVIYQNVQIASGASVYLRADASTNTYNRISSVLAGGASAVEVPDCAHPTFGDHIRQRRDTTLNRDVFAFYAHVSPDNDNCNTFDRQRTEIKTFNPSPEYLKGRLGETITFSWNFKLDSGFQPSKSFTHIHQLKDVDGDSGTPIITISPRAASPNNRLELIHVNSEGVKNVVQTANLSPFLGQWVHVKEKITYGHTGKYSITISKVSDGTQLFSYTNNAMDLWRKGATYVRPKWGIYRSLVNKEQLRDEIVLFDTFCLAKGSDTCP